LFKKLQFVEIFTKISHKFHFFRKKSWRCEQNGLPPKKVIFFVEFRDVETSSISREKNREKGAREKLRTSRGPSLIGRAVKFKA
jgi:hypothetical protein